MTGRPARSPVVLAAVVAAALACGGTLVDHGGVGALGNAATCGEGQVTCGGTCVTQTPLACGPSCSPCAAAPVNATETCTPVGAGGHDGMCGFACDAGLLRCGSGCCAPDLVAAGGAFSCATTTTGGVHCFGAGEVGQLGNGLTVDRATSAELRGFASPVSALAAGNAHACALSGGATLCWGDGAAFGSSGAVLDPQVVPSLNGATAISAGTSHTCGILAGGALLCVGADATAGGGSPALGGPALEVAAGDGFTCALVGIGGGSTAVKCWGADGSGQLGDGPTPGSATAIPLAVAVPAAVSHLAAGARHACAGAETTDNQTLYCWGDNASNQVGVPGATTLLAPAPSTRVKKPVLAISAGGHATCAMQDDGNAALSCWSSDPLVAGGGAPPGEPNPIASGPPGPPRFAFSAGGAHTCYVDVASTPPRLKCFGTGARGRLGNGSVVASTTPVLVLDR